MTLEDSTHDARRDAGSPQGLRGNLESTHDAPHAVAPLTDDERCELERLRAEKAARERRELEALRAEASAASSVAPEVPAHRGASRNASDQQARSSSVPKDNDKPSPPTTDDDELRRIAEARARGERLMVPDEDTLAMPAGQKIVLAAIAVVALIALALLLFPFD